MESKWYLFPGQTLDNTKISDRAHALHITKDGWDKITKHLDRKKLIQEAIDKENATKKYLEEGSRAMTQGWENSLENVRKRKEEERLKEIEQKKDERMQKFLEMRKEQEATRKEYREKVKKKVFMTTGHARALSSALITSEVLFERQKQQEFQNMIKNKEKEDDAKFVAKIREDAIKELEEKEETKRILLEKGKKHGEILKKMVQEREEIQKKQKRDQVREEAIDNIEAFKEIQILEKKIIDEKIAKKKEQAEIKKKMVKDAEERKRQKEKEEKELDEVTDIYREAKHRIDCMKKEREKELQLEIVARREAVTKLVAAEEQNRTEEEQRAIRKAIEEKESQEMEKLQAKATFANKMREERLEDRRKFLEREKLQKENEEEMKKWELLNRYKANENTKKYEEKRRKEAWEKILECRRELLEQMEENKQEILREKLIDDAFVLMNMAENDERFFQYADEVLTLAKNKGRSTYPIEKVINEYVKNYTTNNSKPKQQNNCLDQNPSQQVMQRVKKNKFCKCKLK